MIEYALAAAGIAAAAKVHQWFKENELNEARRQAELRSLAPPPKEKPAKVKSRRELAKDAETLMHEELGFAKRIPDPIARDAAINAAHARFARRLSEIVETQ